MKMNLKEIIAFIEILIILIIVLVLIARSGGGGGSNFLLWNAFHSFLLHHSFRFDFQFFWRGFSGSGK